MARRGEARRRILDCAVSLVKQHGAGSVSIESVAEKAGSAKGLVHYHFKTKSGLMSAVAEQLTRDRVANWSTAFSAPSASEAVLQTWQLLTNESADGTIRAWHSLLTSSENVADGVVSKLKSEFAQCLTQSFKALLRDELGLAVTVQDEEVGHLLAVIVDGAGFGLSSGTDESELEGAYSAAWLGILSLTQPAS